MKNLFVDIHDVADEVDVSENMDESMLNKRIRDAQRFDLQPMLPSAFYTALSEMLLADVERWNSDDTYADESRIFWEDADGDLALWENQSGGNLTNVEPSDEEGNDWTRIVLYDLWREYLKPYLIRRAYDRFLTWHGRNVAQDDIVQIRDENRIAVTDKGRAEMKNDVKNQAEVYFQDFLKYIDLNGSTIDGTEYLFGQDDESAPDDGIILRAI